MKITIEEAKEFLKENNPNLKKDLEKYVLRNKVNVIMQQFAQMQADKAIENICKSCNFSKTGFDEHICTGDLPY